MAPIRTFTPSGSAASRAPWGLALIIALGLIVRLLEGWSTQESIYFAFVSRLTIGYGDLSPTSLLTRSPAILIGVCGILMTALLAAIAVKALTAATDPGERRGARTRITDESIGDLI
jgi:hypothetical protein